VDEAPGIKQKRVIKQSNACDKKKAETIGGATAKPDPTPRRIDLSTPRDIRLEIAAVYRRMNSGEIETSEGSKLVHVLRQIR